MDCEQLKSGLWINQCHEPLEKSILILLAGLAFPSVLLPSDLRYQDRWPESGEFSHRARTINVSFVFRPQFSLSPLPRLRFHWLITQGVSNHSVIQSNPSWCKHRMVLYGIYHLVSFEEILLSHTVCMQNISITVIHYNDFNIILCTSLVVRVSDY